jgi:type IV secretion system protein VirB1
MPVTLLPDYAACLPAGINATLVAAVIQVESGGNPRAIGVNGGPRLRRQAVTTTQAVDWAKALTASGASIDLGLMQLNSRNLARLGLSIEAAFDPCRNVAAGAEMLRAAYAEADNSGASSESAKTFAALTIYNHGRPGADRCYADQVVHVAVGSTAPDCAASHAGDATIPTGKVSPRRASTGVDGFSGSPAATPSGMEADW